uniref:G_PROTEIN_RECEP_F1_2 domain-containing protein n=1 Tax=Strongyloides venezuelensis TaxID=75913 RepID=A0A0K0FDH6_STRVS
MFTYLDLIQMFYSLPSTILLIIFAILLTNEFLIKKNPIFDNKFYPFILYKVYCDLLTELSTLFCDNAARYNIFGDFYKNNDPLAIYYFLVAGLTYTITFEISFILSLNRFIAVVYPLSMNYWFSKSKIKVWVIVTIVIGLFCGISFVYFNPYYNDLKFGSGFILAFRSKSTPYYSIYYTFLVIFPLAVASTVLNIITIKKITSEYRKSHNTTYNNKLNDLPFIVYSFLSFVCFLLFGLQNMIRAVNYLTINDEMLNNFCDIAIRWTQDAQIFGLFYAILFLCKPLKNLILFRKKAAVAASSNAVQVTIVNRSKSRSTRH